MFRQWPAKQDPGWTIQDIMTWQGYKTTAVPHAATLIWYPKIDPTDSDYEQAGSPRRSTVASWAVTVRDSLPRPSPPGVSPPRPTTPFSEIWVPEEPWNHPTTPPLEEPTANHKRGISTAIPTPERANGREDPEGVALGGTTQVGQAARGDDSAGPRRSGRTKKTTAKAMATANVK